MLDRKSTRLNSSHSQISYAVFCLKKKNKTNTTPAGHHLETPAQRVDCLVWLPACELLVTLRLPLVVGHGLRHVGLFFFLKKRPPPKPPPFPSPAPLRS